MRLYDLFTFTSHIGVSMTEDIPGHIKFLRGNFITGCTGFSVLLEAISSPYY